MVWWKDQIDFNAPQDVCKPEAASRKAILQLEWPADSDASGPSYRLSSAALPLDQLLAIADSVQPYSGP